MQLAKNPSSFCTENFLKAAKCFIGNVYSHNYGWPSLGHSLAATLQEKLICRCDFMKEYSIIEIIPQNNKDDFKKLLPAFLSIWNNPENFKYLSLTFQPFQKEIVSSWFSNHLDRDARYFVAVDDHREIFGISAIKANSIEGFEIIGLGVQPKEKCKGIGSSLITHAIHLAIDLGYKAVDCRVLANNIKMLRILLKLEFIPVQIEYHARADGVDLIHMRKYF